MSDTMALVLQQAIRAERARIGISQEALSERLGWSRTRLAHIETGTRRIYAHELPDICRALNVRLSDLISRASADERHWMG